MMNAPDNTLHDYHVGVVEVVSAQGVDTQANGTPASAITYTVRLINRDGQTVTRSGIKPMYRMNLSDLDIGVDVHPAPVGSLWVAIFANRIVYPFIQEREAIGDCTEGSGGGLLAALMNLTAGELGFLKARLDEIEVVK